MEINQWGCNGNTIKVVLNNNGKLGREGTKAKNRPESAVISSETLSFITT